MGLGASRERRRLEAALAARDEQLAAMKARLDALDAAARADLDADVFAETVLPFTSQALMGSTLGYASGYTLKLVGRVAAVGVGSGFIMLQGLSYLGYVDVDWRKVERDYTRRLDRDGDGEVSSSDLAAIGRDVGDVLAFNLPAGTGFTGGLLYGLNVAGLTRAGGLAAVGGLGARVLLPRVALGGAAGAGATTMPAALVTLKKRLGFWDDDDAAAAP
jgi:uncharacterized membrane protein (Fun14 family)